MLSRGAVLEVLEAFAQHFVDDPVGFLAHAATVPDVLPPTAVEIRFCRAIGAEVFLLDVRHVGREGGM